MRAIVKELKIIVNRELLQCRFLYQILAQQQGEKSFIKSHKLIINGKNHTIEDCEKLFRKTIPLETHVDVQDSGHFSGTIRATTKATRDGKSANQITSRPNLRSTSKKRPDGIITIMHQNIQSIRNKIEDITTFLLECEEKGQRVDILCFSESWLNTGETDTINITNYNAVSYFSRSMYSHGDVKISSHDNVTLEKNWQFENRVRRSLKIRGRRKDKEKLPSGITADYTADFLASLERTDSPISTTPGSPLPSGHHHNNDGYTQSDSSETSLNSLNNPHNQKNLPPLPPKPPKRGILKTPKVNVTQENEEPRLASNTNGFDTTDRNHTNLVRNTLQNELITYQNLPVQNGLNGKDMGSQLLVITSTSPSADSLTDTTNSSFATPPFSLSPVGESQGFHRWSRTANFDDVNLPLPDIVPLVLPKPRILTIQRQKPPRNDFGFSLRRAMVLERCANAGGAGDCGSELGVSMRAVIFAEPGAIVQHNNETGLLPGDKLLEVNGTPVDGKTREDIIDLIKASGESVTLKVSAQRCY
ncbi:hypothetical protein JTB14_009559 [Gonioctena quinquepunctata]|nr:hypothetical protein JTB14_009559 [Gonioctena quinquepunctata]